MSDVASACVLLIALLVLVGWTLKVPWLKSVIPGRVAMNPLSAVGFSFSALSLYLHARRRSDHAPGVGTVVALGTAMVVTFIGLVTLVGYAVGHDLGLDQILFTDQLHGNHIAPNTGLSFVMAGVALTALGREDADRQRLAQTSALLTAVIASVLLIGYAYGVQVLYGVASYIPMALNTALAFMFLAIGMLTVTESAALVVLLSSQSAGGVTLRRLMPLAIAMPVGTGWLILLGQRGRFYDAAFGVSLLVVAIVVVLGPMIWRTAGLLDRADLARRQAEAALDTQYRVAESARGQISAVLDTVSEAVILVSPQRRVLSINRRFTDIFGIAPERVIGRSVQQLRAEIERLFADGSVMRAFAATPGAVTEPRKETVFQQAPAARELELYRAPVRAPDQTALGILFAFRDVTLEREMQRFNEARRQQLETEIAQAAQIQSALLPAEALSLEGFELAARCLPAREVGGDFFDWHQPVAGVLTLTLGDVMGKGMPAALLMASARASLQAAARYTRPDEAVRAVATALERDLESSGSFITLFHAHANLEERSLQYVDAGHGHVFLRRADGSVRDLPPRNLPLGVFAGVHYEQGLVALAPGDALVVYSDGFIDGSPNEAVDSAQIAGLLEGAESADGMLERLLSFASTAAARPDDLTVLVLRCQRQDEQDRCRPEAEPARGRSPLQTSTRRRGEEGG